MIFKDLKSSPVKIVVMNEIPFSNFIQTFETNRYLEIPRITSKQFLMNYVLHRYVIHSN